MRFKICCALVAFLGLTKSYADVTITGTRIIFPSNQNSITVQLNNPISTPALVQAWLDDGDPALIPAADKIPFILTPPLTTIEPKKGQMIRLISKDTSGLKTDRESLFWFNILDIPPNTTDAEGKNKLNIAVRSRIKLFYRPARLQISQDKAFNSVVFQYSNSTKTLKINNPSPYYLSFMSLAINPDQQNIAYNDVLMVEPYGSERINPKLNFIPTQIKYGLINDYGSVNVFQVKIEVID